MLSCKRRRLHVVNAAKSSYYRIIQLRRQRFASLSLSSPSLPFSHFSSTESNFAATSFQSKVSIIMLFSPFSFSYKTPILNPPPPVFLVIYRILLRNDFTACNSRSSLCFSLPFFSCCSVQFLFQFK